MTASEYILTAINTKIKEGHRLSNDEISKVMEATSIIAEDEDTFNVFKNIFKKATSKKYHLLNVLTKRELELLRLIGQKKSSSTIADILFIKLSTVETHRKNIRRKLKLTSNNELFEYALVTNILRLTNFKNNKLKL